MRRIGVATGPRDAYVEGVEKMTKETLTKSELDTIWCALVAHRATLPVGPERADLAELSKKIIRIMGTMPADGDS